MSPATGNVVWFTAVSLFAKVAMQEVAKHYILKRKTRNIRSMSVVVVVPTVMIDTQMRLVLMTQQTTNGTVSGLVVLALVEIVVRALKLVVTNVTIARKKRRLLARIHTQVQPEVKALLDLELHEWCRRVHKFHTTEVAADMYAEYLAIGCSYAIVFFFNGHPNFSLGARRHEPMPTSDGATSLLAKLLFAESQVLILALQIGTELVVDWVSCYVEIRTGGLDFETFERDRMFYIVFFVTIAVLNIYVSSVLYLNPSRGQ